MLWLWRKWGLKKFSDFLQVFIICLRVIKTGREDNFSFYFAVHTKIRTLRSFTTQGRNPGPACKCENEHEQIHFSSYSTRFNYWTTRNTITWLIMRSWHMPPGMELGWGHNACTVMQVHRTLLSLVPLFTILGTNWSYKSEHSHRCGKLIQSWYIWDLIL